MRRPFVPIPVLALAVGLAAAPAAATESPWGRKIEHLSFRGDAPIEEESLAKLTDVEPGSTLTERAVHSSLRNLFATGRFADLALEAAPTEGGAVVTIVFAATARVAKVKVTGRGIPAKGRGQLAARPQGRWQPAPLPARNHRIAPRLAAGRHRAW